MILLHFKCQVEHTKHIQSNYVITRDVKLLINFIEVVISQSISLSNNYVGWGLWPNSVISATPETETGRLQVPGFSGFQRKFKAILKNLVGSWLKIKYKNKIEATDEY